MHQTPGQPQHPYGQQPQQWGPPPPPPAKKSGAKVVVIIGAVIVALALVGIAISASGDEEPGPAASTSSARPTSGQRDVPSPNADQAAAYLAALQEIDPGLVVNEERALRRAGRVCERIINPPGGSMSLTEYTVEELSGGNATINAAQARQVIKAVKAWCRPA